MEILEFRMDEISITERGFEPGGKILAFKAKVEEVLHIPLSDFTKVKEEDGFVWYKHNWSS